MGSAAGLKPHRRLQSWTPRGVGLQVPSGPRFSDEKKLDGLSAPARTPHSHAPVFVALARENQITPRQSRREAIAFDDLQAAPRPVAIEDASKPPRYHRAAFFRRRPKIGNPRSGSWSPRANTGLGAEANVDSAKKSSSQAAKLNMVRA